MEKDAEYQVILFNETMQDLLYQALVKSGMTEDQLADKMGVSVLAICMLLGDIEYPSLDEIVVALSHLGKRIDLKLVDIDYKSKLNNVL